MKFHGVLVIKNSSAVELVLNPVAFVGGFSLAVVKSSFSLHQVVSEISLVERTLFVEHFSMAFFNSINHHSFEVSSILVFLSTENGSLLALIGSKLDNLCLML